MNANILETIGTPLVRVDSPPGATIAAKIESKNPGGSAKDRPALAMVERAERAGDIEPGDALVEPTSGNTGIGLSVAAAAKGYDLTVVMPASQSPERRELMRAYGAEIELIEGTISDAKDRADELENGGMTQLRQFENPANPDAHYLTTAEEILEQIEGRTVDALVAGVGTGGTLSGIGRRLREEFPDMSVIAVEPAENAVISGSEPASDDFQGMGPGFISPNLDTELIDSVETVSIDAAESECRRLAREEGILVGQSSAASNIAAKRIATQLADPTQPCNEREPGYVIEDLPGSEPAAISSSSTSTPTSTDTGDIDTSGVTDAPDTDKKVEHESGMAIDSDESDLRSDCPLIITVFWDSGERYMSTGLFNDSDSGQDHN
ncbi:PLP-dependent cysteine synthase family protein [Haloquadratum walsbyi]|uniref:Cysteine synthase n=1 Tax=Haloquadratum walsbyi J07HQW2 TaxID=1238425 RepID=U1MWD2_9EURY|nr:PLP-dependent cysteine synthase family protein [Haloquadratum walsbyi]ERG94744.1 MAG: cysteine synthase [Haloquadratum walsbyi J07HQW2]